MDCFFQTDLPALEHTKHFKIAIALPTLKGKTHFSNKINPSGRGYI
jgi:hypothetical protein